MKRRKKKVNLLLIIVVLILVLLFRLVEDVGDDGTVQDRFTVTKIFDGDTFEILGGDKVRMISVDTPEKGELYYDEAKSFVQHQLLGKVVKLEYGSYRRDRYGRLLAYVYLDTLFINKLIIENGLGFLYLFRDNAQNPHTFELLESQKTAIQNQIGLWSLEKVEEDFYLSSAGSYRIHRPGCKSIQESPDNYQKYLTRVEAFNEGLSPCRNCKP